MKKTISIFVLVLTTTIVFAAKGIILTQKYVTGNSGQQISVTWFITDSQCKLKMQFSDKDVNTTTYFIPDLKSNRLLTYSDGPTPAGVTNTYYSLPVQNIQSHVETSTVQRTGETKSINGFNCEKIIASTANGSTEMWVTKDLSVAFYKFASFFKSSSELKALSENKITGVPLASVTKNISGNTSTAYELVSVVSSEISDSEFVIPSEYKSAEESAKKKD